MKALYFPRLAWTGIRKNRRLYLPYILSCIGMILMLYILQSLSSSALLGEMSRGGSSLGFILSLGRFVIAAFSLLFLFYTNSFLIRCRNKEFGLYSVLGMGKGGIAKIILWETLIVAAISLSCGLILGIAFSKFAELGLRNILRTEIDYTFTVSGSGIVFTCEIFGGIFFLLLLRSLWKVSRSRPMELLKSEHTGEKPPKANWVFAVLGVVLLVAAYWLALSCRSAVTAISFFFAAVLMVIAATYLLFLAGSVALCRILQKNKRYYYHKKHFVFVSSMVYRMKRNGAGLASICILSTMVLVMISSSSSLYFGANDAIRSRYPRDIELTFDFHDPENADLITETLSENFTQVLEEKGAVPENTVDYCFASIAAFQNGNRFEPDYHNAQYATLSFDDVRQLLFLRAEDYTRLTGQTAQLSGNGILFFPNRCAYPENTLRIGDLELNITGRLTEFPIPGSLSSQLQASLICVVSDFDVLQPLVSLRTDTDEPMLTFESYCAFDLDADADTQIDIYLALNRSFSSAKWIIEEYGGGWSSSCAAAEKDDFFSTFGGLFFIGILLSIVFIFAAAMIIYYKQVSEGYEDQSRFAVMQKVGMTREDIRQSINAQTVTVFSAPLLLAGIHLIFAFPPIWQILQAFNLQNLKLVILVTAGAYLLFGLIYAIIYKLTAKAYYLIVSNA